LSTIGESALANELTDARVKMAFYGHLFLQPGAQGPGELMETAETRAVAEQLAAEWIARAATRATDAGIRGDGEAAMVELRPQAGRETMGVMSPVRSAANRLARIRYFAKPTFAFAERVANRALQQVTLYVTNSGNTRDRALAEVDHVFTDDTKIVIAHSLGSVVAYEACHRRRTKLPLLVTLGSPLGLDTIVYPRTIPQPAMFPTNVQRWVNIADLDDIVAADPTLARVFPAPAGSSISDHQVDNGAHPHDAVEYLKQAIVAYVVALALLRAAS
jgi:hypothetical protein